MVQVSFIRPMSGEIAVPPGYVSTLDLISFIGLSD